MRNEYSVILRIVKHENRQEGASRERPPLRTWRIAYQDLPAHSASGKLVYGQAYTAARVHYKIRYDGVTPALEIKTMETEAMKTDALPTSIQVAPDLNTGGDLQTLLHNTARQAQSLIGAGCAVLYL